MTPTLPVFRNMAIKSYAIIVAPAPTAEDEARRLAILKEEESEPVLQPAQNRFFLSRENPDPAWLDAWKMYLDIENLHWRAEEVDVTTDRADWKRLSENEQHFYTHIFGMFGFADGIVTLHLTNKIINRIQNQYVGAFYRLQAPQEDTHAQVYAHIIEKFIEDRAEHTKLINAMETMPCMKRKADWALKWLNGDDVTFAEGLVAFAIVEGIFFSGAFCAIFWLKKRGLMPRLCNANEFIARDEHLHCEYAVLLYKRLDRKLPQSIVHRMVYEAIEIEVDFMTQAVPVPLIGLSSESMIQYVQFIADRLLTSLGYDKLYHVTNPYEWMMMIGMEGKTNFFEKLVSEYRISATAPSDPSTLAMATGSTTAYSSSLARTAGSATGSGGSSISNAAASSSSSVTTGGKSTDRVFCEDAAF